MTVVEAWNDGRHSHGCQPWIPAYPGMTVVGAWNDGRYPHG